MARKKTPYEVLGVRKQADGEELKCAYRKRSLETHPDRGGTKEEFTEVSTAFAMLSDPERRRRYDRNGDESVRMKDNWQKILSQEFVAAVQETVNAGCEETSDLVESVRRRLRVKVAEGDKALCNLKRAEDGLKKSLSRLKDPKDFLAGILRQELAGVVAKQSELAQVRDDFYAALKYAEDCRYVFEKPEVKKYNATFTCTVEWTFK